ncbi:MAG: DNA topoisomerase IV subunit A, partial [Rhodospirillaceae bacterium]|nr:DNA topoisomerase IV subunit A [Rhodospirillaceae bacterium]
MNKTIIAGEIRDTQLIDILSEQYLNYAMSTIVSRSLPDVRDGLKPVHRRLLYAMHQLKLDPTKGFKKCARIVGDVIGKYHPHGDMAVYETMVRLAQDFAVRYPLVEGQGNFGNIDGDSAAAMRYTEARLTAFSVALMVGMNENAVDFRSTYDGVEEEPVVMPAAIPNLLANGAAGIAVGMATSIPPHNMREICEALIYLINHNDCSVDDLIDFLPGPDFPTGGILIETKEVIKEAYRTGHGSFRLRSRWFVEDRDSYKIIITEIPYQVHKSKLIEKIAQLIEDKKIPFLLDVRDESTDKIRIVLELRNRLVDIEMLMEQLFRQTDLETRILLNVNVLDSESMPRVMTLKEVLLAFLDHRHIILLRRSNFNLEKIEKRLEILSGFLKVYFNIDDVIRIIRQDDDPKQSLMVTYDLSELQSEAILDMRLRSLRKLEELGIKDEYSKLLKECSNIKLLLTDEKKRWSYIAEEIVDIKTHFGKDDQLGRRRTDIDNTYYTKTLEVFIKPEDITVILSKRGWIRAVKGNVINYGEFKFKDGDDLKIAVHAKTTDKLIFFATSGRFFTIGCDKLHLGRGQGEPLRLMIDLNNDAEIITMVLYHFQISFLISSFYGYGFLTNGENVISKTR